MVCGGLGVQRTHEILCTVHPPELVDEAVNAYRSIVRNLQLRRYGASELNAERFVEAVYRLVECHTRGGEYTPPAGKVPDLVDKLLGLADLPAATCDECFRLHIPRVLLAIYQVRTERAPAGGDPGANPDLADAILVTTCADWVMARLLCATCGLAPPETQELVQRLTARPTPIVWEIGGTRRPVTHSLTVRDTVLLLLADAYPGGVTTDDLASSVEVRDDTYLERLVRQLHTSRFVELTPFGHCTIRPAGMRYVESRVQSWRQPPE